MDAQQHTHMKQRTFRTTELALVATVTLGCIFKILHWPGAGLLMVLGAGLLALFYFPFGWRTLPSPKPTDQILWMTVLCGAAACSALGGLLAYFQHWPHGPLLLEIGALACGSAMALGAIMRYKHPGLDLYLDGLMIRCGALGGLAFTLWFLFAGKPH